MGQPRPGRFSESDSIFGGVEIISEVVMLQSKRLFLRIGSESQDLNGEVS